MDRAIPMRVSRGGGIPRAARMLCIADVYDAHVLKRSYKGALSQAAEVESLGAPAWSASLLSRMCEVLRRRTRRRIPSDCADGRRPAPSPFRSIA